MKSQRGITLASLAIYVVLIFTVLAILAAITSNMQSGVIDSEKKGTGFTEINKFNIYFLKDVKKQQNRIQTITLNDILFTSGNRYTYNSEKKNIYLNNQIKIAENIETCEFTRLVQNEKTIIRVIIKQKDSPEKTIDYVLNNDPDNSIYENEEDYTRTEREDITPVTYAKREDLPQLEGTNVSLVAYEDLTGDIKSAADSGIVSAVLNETIDENDTIAIVPTGFIISPLTGEDTISGGLVIYEMTETQKNAIDWTDPSEVSTAQSTYNQFVWIPVATLSQMAVPVEQNSSNYRGVLSDWNSDGTGATAYSYNANSGKREPANLTDEVETGVAYDSQGAFTEYGGGTYTNTMYQTEFNEMVESVGKYKGFYVGRYETGGFTGSTVLIKAGKSDINSVYWYKAYQMQKNYASENTVIGSSMIWGCQWDAVMKFVNGKEDGAQNTFNVKIARTTEGSTRHTGSRAATGNNINDKVQNIYDLEGNVREWTMEAVDTSDRVYRGGNYSNSNFAAVRSNYYPADSSSSIGSRIAIYIK